MKHVPWRETGWALAFVVLLLAVYVGGYLVLVERASEWVPTPAPVDFECVPEYQFGDEFLEDLLPPDPSDRPPHQARLLEGRRLLPARRSPHTGR